MVTATRTMTLAVHILCDLNECRVTFLSFIKSFVDDWGMCHVLTFPELFGLKDTHVVEALQDQAQVLLGEYIRHQHPRQPTRFGRLLLMIPSLRVVPGSVISRLFFKETVGSIPVEKLLCDIYQNESRSN